MTPVRTIPGLHWPVVDLGDNRPLQRLLGQLGELEWASPDTLRAGQDRQLRELNHYLVRRCPFHHQRLLAAGLDPSRPLGLEELRHLPLLTRRDVQCAASRLFSQAIPEGHQPASETRTSGSSGEPVMVLRTQVSQLFWLAYTMREHLWWQRDLSGTLAVVRGNLSHTIRQDNWGPPVSLLGPSGPAHAFAMNQGSDMLLRQLQEVAADYLLIYPNVLEELLRLLRQQNGTLRNLRQIRCIGETLSQELREQTRELLGVEIADTYSSQEVGIIAIQCPSSGLYHLMAENLIVEILDAQGKHCADGEIGEVVVSDLHNFATPLLRYALGDHAEVGGLCPCGRQLPTLRRLLGRSRNMLRYPDGSRRWPCGFDPFRQIAPAIRQFQMIQTHLEQLELRLAVSQPLAAEQQTALVELIQQALAHPFDVTFRYFNDRIPSGPGGKFEEFVCALPD